MELDARGMPGLDRLPEVRESLTDLAEDFFTFPHAHRTEQSIHCYLYHLLAKKGLDAVFESGGGYRVRALQKEYPPVISEPGRRHGLLDMVILDQERMGQMKEWNYTSSEGQYVPPAIAIELKLGDGLRWKPQNVRLKDFEKELSRLADDGNRVTHPFLLYFYRVARYKDDDSQVVSFKRLEEIFVEGARRHPRVFSWLVSVEFDPSRRYGRYSGSILRLEGGEPAKTTRDFDDLA